MMNFDEYDVLRFRARYNYSISDILDDSLFFDNVKYGACVLMYEKHISTGAISQAEELLNEITSWILQKIEVGDPLPALSLLCSHHCRGKLPLKLDTEQLGHAFQKRLLEIESEYRTCGKWASAMQTYKVMQPYFNWPDLVSEVHVNVIPVSYSDIDHRTKLHFSGHGSDHGDQIYIGAVKSGEYAGQCFILVTNDGYPNRMNAGETLELLPSPVSYDSVLDYCWKRSFTVSHNISEKEFHQHMKQLGFEE